MGNIRQVIAENQIEPRTLTANQIWGDVCENIHLHYRNFRLDMSVKEFATFMNYLNQIHTAVTKIIDTNHYEEGHPEFLVQAQINRLIPADSTYYPNRFLIELQRDNTVHVHYRDLRLHMTIPEFKQIANAFKNALEAVIPEFPYASIKERIRTKIPIELIQPYDKGHLPGELDKEHRAGVDFIKEQIKAGKKIRPILVRDDGQRIDGFKRYMAFKELGYKEIEVFVDPFASIDLAENNRLFMLGGQHDLGLFDDGEDEKFYIPCPECQKKNNMVVLLKDSGYAYCHDCEIFYTEWKNIQYSEYNRDYLARYTNYENNYQYYEYATNIYMPKILSFRGGKKGNFMDIGFIHPRVMDNFNKAGFKTFGVEINKSAMGDTEKHNIIIGNFETVEIPEKMDVIWSSHVFEHLKEPFKAMKKVYDTLNSGGVFFLALPDPATIHPESVSKWGHWHLNEHHILPKQEKTIKELEKCGFEVVFKFRNNDPRFISVADYHIIARKP